MIVLGYPFHDQEVNSHAGNFNTTYLTGHSKAKEPVEPILALFLERICGVVSTVGIQVDGHPIPDVSTLAPDKLVALSFHNPAAFRVDPSTITPEQIAARKANTETLYVYDSERLGGDPKLQRRLRHVKIPVLVAWGESDRVADLEYGRVYAQSFPNARFEPIPEAGHLPQIEQPERLLNLVWKFAVSIRTTPTAGSFEER